MFLAGDLKGRKFEIENNPITMGRSSENTIQINDPMVSGKHCKVSKDGDSYSFTDLNSTNGSIVNQQQISGTIALNPRDMIVLGAVQIVFEAPELTPKQGAGVSTTTTGIVVKTGVSPREISADQSAGFAAKKDNKVILYLLISLGAACAIGMFVWFIIKLFKD